MKEDEIRNPDELVSYIEEKLDAGDKILIAVDNVHTEKTVPIFSIIKDIKSYIKKDDIRFILTTRIPEFNRLVEERPGEVPSEKIRGLINELHPEIKFDVPYLNHQEIKGFIKNYRKSNAIKQLLKEHKLNDNNVFQHQNRKKLDELASIILKETEDYPILVKFFLFRKGLAEDVRTRFFRYLARDETKLITVLTCAILDRAGITITNDLLTNLGLKEYANELQEETITFSENEKIWKTIHSKWDLELLAFLYSAEDKSILTKGKQLFRKPIHSVFNFIDDRDKYMVLRSLYDATTTETEKNRKLPMNIIEFVVTEGENLINMLNKSLRYHIYNFYVAKNYYYLGQYDKGQYDNSLRALECAIKIFPKVTDAWLNKGRILREQARFDEAESIYCYDKIIHELDFMSPDAWYNKGLTHASMNQYTEAAACFGKVVVELEEKHVGAWLKYGLANYKLGKNEMVVFCFTRITEELDPRNVDAWLNKGIILGKMNLFDASISCFDKIIMDLDSEHVQAWYYKGLAYASLGQDKEALVCPDKIVNELDTTNKEARDRKSIILEKISKMKVTNRSS